MSNNHSNYDKINIVRRRYGNCVLLLYWPVFLLLNFLIERVIVHDTYYSVHCFLDDLIPFNEIWLLPYFLWHILHVVLLLYTMVCEDQVFRQLMWYIIITYSLAIIFYIVFPSCQELRPDEFVRNNILTKGTALLYAVDTNTNVCPSTHVIGSFGLAFAAGRCERFSSVSGKVVIWITAMLICASTAFMKQHSVIDFFAALPVCALGYFLCFERMKDSSLAER